MKKEFQGKKNCHTQKNVKDNKRPEFKSNLKDESQIYLYKIILMDEREEETSKKQ